MKFTEEKTFYLPKRIWKVIYFPETRKKNTKVIYFPKMLQKYFINTSRIFQHSKGFSDDQIAKHRKVKTSRQHRLSVLWEWKGGGDCKPNWYQTHTHTDSNHTLLHQKYHMQFDRTFKGFIKCSPKEWVSNQYFFESKTNKSIFKAIYRNIDFIFFSF